MKKVKFILYNGKESACEFETPYTINDGYVCFSHLEYDYKIKLEEKVEFHRVSKSEEFVLNSGKFGLIHLKDLDKTFEIEVMYFNHTKSDKKWVIQYELESDLGVLKTIELHFVP